MLHLSAVYGNPRNVMIFEFIFVLDLLGGVGVELCMN